MLEMRNNVVLSIACGDAETAKLLGKGLCHKYELSGNCLNVRTVANKHGDMVLSLRSMDPMETVMDIGSTLKQLGFRNFDLAFRHKLTEDWSIFHVGRIGCETGPKLSSTDCGFAVRTKRNRKIGLLLTKTTLSL